MSMILMMMVPAGLFLNADGSVDGSHNMISWVTRVTTPLQNSLFQALVSHVKYGHVGINITI